MRSAGAVMLVAAMAMTATAVPAGGAFAGIPNVEVEYYDVSGRSVQTIREAINRHPSRPRDPNDGRATDAAARWSIRWSWPGDRRGGCNLSRAQVRFSARILLPRLIGEANVPAPVLARWRAYRTALETHEDGHIRHVYDRRAEVLRAIRASSCASANAAAQAALAIIGRHDADYDRATRHGATQGATFP